MRPNSLICHLTRMQTHFTAILRCTSQESVDSKTISKWARALRDVARCKKPDTELTEFMKKAGSVNGCAARYAQTNDEFARKGRFPTKFAMPVRGLGKAQVVETVYKEPLGELRTQCTEVRPHEIVSFHLSSRFASHRLTRVDGWRCAYRSCVEPGPMWGMANLGR